MQLSAEFNRIRETLATLSSTTKNDYVRITAVQEAVVFTTDDTQARWALQMPAEVTTAGEAYVPFKRLRAHFSAYDGGLTEINLEPRALRLSHAGVRGTLPLIDPTLFPVSPKFAAERPVAKFTAEMPSFLTAVSGCLPCTGQRPGFEYTTGIQINTTHEDGFLVATDRAQAIQIQIRGNGNPLSFTVDAKQLMHVASMAGDSVTIEYDGARAKFRNEYFLAYLQTYQDNPPAIPVFLEELVKNSPCRTKIPSVFFIEALSLAGAVAGDRESFYSYLELGPEGCRLKANGELADEVDIDLHATTPHSLKAYINHITLLRCLRAFHKLKLCEDSVELLHNGPRDPILILFTDDAKNRYAVSAIIPPQLEPPPEHNPPT